MAGLRPFIIPALVFAGLVGCGAQDEVDLPAAANLEETNTPTVVTLTDQQELICNTDSESVAYSEDSLQACISTLLEAGTDQMIYVSIHSDVRYGLAMEMIAQIRQAGFGKIAFITQPSEH